MENASKALLIAAGVMLTIALLSLMTYLFSTMAQNVSEIKSSFDESEISEFNQKFLSFQGKDLTIQDVVSLVNLAKYNNDEKNPNTLPASVVVKVDGDEWTEKKSQELNACLKSNLGKFYNINTIKHDPKTDIVNFVDIKMIAKFGI